MYNEDFKIVLNKLKEKVDIIFLDPPYKTNFAIDAIKIILENNLIKEESMIIIETDIKDELMEQLENLNCNIYDIRKYGRAYIIFLKGGK